MDSPHGLGAQINQLLQELEGLLEVEAAIGIRATYIREASSNCQEELLFDVFLQQLQTDRAAVRLIRTQIDSINEKIQKLAEQVQERFIAISDECSTPGTPALSPSGTSHIPVWHQPQERTYSRSSSLRGAPGTGAGTSHPAKNSSDKRLQ
ncbi:hypothetical protein SeLEV6574_g00389 [Synchytrium endobioticum]|nr:hypothetical protein SeLEV6574_g00389 [Synchytrium endobioticum]